MLTSAEPGVQTQMSKFVQHVPISLPNLPAALEGLRLAHVTDVHANRPRRRHDVLARELAAGEVDLLMLTGDYIIHPGDEPAGVAALERMLAEVRPRLGTFGVFGNHDTPLLCREAQRLPVRWLRNEAVDLPGLPLRVMGMHSDTVARPDSVALLNRLADMPAGAGVGGEDDVASMKLLLCHYPNVLPTAADMGIDLVAAGHTHGGQCRLPGGRALINSTDLPLHLSSGILRHRDTLCAVSRGLGEVALPLRVFCRPHLPIYELRRGPMRGTCCDDLRNVLPW